MLLRGLMLSLLSFTLVASTAFAQSPPTLQDFWEGRAAWVLDIPDVGLPIGESDTVYRGDGVYWAYLHASDQSAGIVDQCGEPVEFPGCMTRWESTDGGQSFALNTPVCAMACTSCPCDDVRDHITAQQYPRVFFAGDQDYLAYEWHAQVMLRTSTDGLNWSNWSYLLTPGGTWPTSYAPCSATETIGEHPNIRGQLDNCLVGAPPGIYVEGDTLYVFVAAGSAPGHMRCYKGDRHGNLAKLKKCDHDPIFSGSDTYGPMDITAGAAIDPYFDFRYVSAADVLKVGDHYYMAYEGVRGPDVLERGMDTQFGLGFARSISDAIDGDWEKYPSNPILMDVSPNFGIGHADLLIVDGVTMMYTATSEKTRGRYILSWIE
ncbi:MAG: hypothetical protein ABI690_19530 [Chloroflexota bacterium]